MNEDRELIRIGLNLLFMVLLLVLMATFAIGMFRIQSGSQQWCENLYGKEARSMPEPAFRWPPLKVNCFVTTSHPLIP